MAGTDNIQTAKFKVRAVTSNSDPVFLSTFDEEGVKTPLKPVLLTFSKIDDGDKDPQTWTCHINPDGGPNRFSRHDAKNGSVIVEEILDGNGDQKGFKTVSGKPPFSVRNDIGDAKPFEALLRLIDSEKRRSENVASNQPTIAETAARISLTNISAQEKNSKTISR